MVEEERQQRPSLLSHLRTLLLGGKVFLDARHGHHVFFL